MRQKKGKQKNVSRDEKARAEAHVKQQKELQKKKIEEQMKEPINQFINIVEKDGKTIKYPIAVRLRKYFNANPDPIINALRMVNSLTHEVRYHKVQSKKYFEASQGFEIMNDNQGKALSEEECYVKYISEKQVCHTVMAKLREHIVRNLVGLVDGDLFTFKQFNDCIMQVEKILKDLGYELFPDKVELIEVL